jgi:hypothetical protein
MFANKYAALDVYFTLTHVTLSSSEVVTKDAERTGLTDNPKYQPPTQPPTCPQQQQYHHLNLSRCDQGQLF